MLTLGCLAAALLTLFTSWWVGECAVHWHRHLLVLSLLPVPLLRQRWWLLSLVSVSILMIPFFNPVATRANSALQSGERLIIANCSIATSVADSAAHTLSDLDPDVVVVIESTPRMVRALTARLPEHHVMVDDGPIGAAYGVAILSRRPFTHVAHLVRGNPVIEAVIGEGPDQWRLITCHPCPPVGRNGFTWRNQVFEIVAELASANDLPTVVCGDFNSTSASPWFKAMCERGGLEMAPSPPRTWPQPWTAFGIAIDHILVRGAIERSALERVPLPGSDHSGVMTTVAPAPVR